MSPEGWTQALALVRQIGQQMEALVADFGDLKTRATTIDRRLSGLSLAAAGANNRLNRLDGRLARIERRLDLTDAHDAR